MNALRCGDHARYRSLLLTLCWSHTEGWENDTGSFPPQMPHVRTLDRASFEQGEHCPERVRDTSSNRHVGPLFMHDTGTDEQAEDHLPDPQRNIVQRDSPGTPDHEKIGRWPPAKVT